MENNHGFNPEQQKKDESEEDWFFGAKDLTGIADKVAGLVIALEAWPKPKDGVYPRVNGRINHVVIFFNKLFKEIYPKGEVQRGLEDFMDCVARGFNNEIEKQLNWLWKNDLLSQKLMNWLKEKKYAVFDKDENFIGIELSDRFPAINSNTTRRGNSMKAPIEAIRKKGCIPNVMLPKEKNMTWAVYHDKNKITQEMYDLGLEFEKRIKINYLTVLEKYFSNFAGKIKWEVFDNYIDVIDGDYVKRLAPNYKFWYRGYKVLINLVPQHKQKEEDKGEEKMVFYKASENPDPGKLYQLGKGSKMYHHVLDEPTFYDLYGKFEDNEIIDMKIIPNELIGRPVGQPSSFARILNNLFQGLKGKR